MQLPITSCWVVCASLQPLHHCPCAPCWLATSTRMECAECADDAASEQFAKLVRKLSVCEEEDRTERRAFVSRHAAQAGTTVAATLAQLQEAGVLSQEQVVVAVPPHWPVCSLLCHHCAGGGVGWPRSGGSGARDSACTGRDASR